MRKIIAVLLAAVLLPILAVGCTPTEPAGPSGPEAQTPTLTKILHKDDWKDEHPEIYESIMLGANVIKVDEGNRTHSHAAMLENTTNGVDHDMSVYFNTVSARCLLCKSEDFLNIYETYGEDALLSMTYDDVLPMVQDCWGCYNCHENDPGNTVKATLQYWEELYKGAAQPISDEDATCGQCHNIFHAHKAAEGLTLAKMEEFNPYKYGYGADEMRRAVAEDGLGVSNVDEATGLVTFFLIHPDVEIFQSSQHKILGMSCHSCHMPKVVSDEGVAYTYHDASGSPLKNEDALKSCLVCHSNSGVMKNTVDTTGAMVDFVRGVQGEVAAMENKINADLDVLYDLVLEAIEDGASDEDLKDVKEAWTTAKYYVLFTRGVTAKAGVKAPHNAPEMRELLTKAQQLLDDAIASF